MTEPVTCQHCGALEYPERWSVKEKLVNAQLCLSCFYWQDITTDASRIIIDGQCYSIGPEDSKYKGFAGFAWAIKLADGAVVYTTNLNHRGQVPASWRDVLPDNAEFVK